MSSHKLRRVLIQCGIPTTKSDEVIKSSVEDLVSIPTKDHFEIVINSNDDISSNDDDSLYNENIDSGSTTTHSDISLPDYEVLSFNKDHINEISSGSTTTHSDISLSEYDSFIFDLTHEEFADELTHIISPAKYDCFYFWNLPDPGERKTRKGQNQIKTGQKREAWRCRKKFKAVAVGRARKTEQNAKRMAKNANAVKSYTSLKRKKKRKGSKVQMLQSSNTRTNSAYFLKLWCQGLAMQIDI
nr:hypothetical protein [Tanacetum cinerariifolium]